MPLYDNALEDFFHDVLQAITMLDDEMIRPSWQPNPPARPANDVSWLGFRLGDMVGDFDPYLKQLDHDGGQTQQQNEKLTLFVSAYGPYCQSIAALIRDCLQIRQNLDVMYSVGIKLTSMGQITRLPEQINTIWYDRADIEIYLVRQIDQTFNVLFYTAAEGIIVTDNGFSIPWSAGTPSAPPTP